MIAIAGPNLPHDLLAATGRMAGPVAFDPERDTSRARQWLESKFAPWTAAVLEAWAEGAYDDLAQVLFSRADDSSQRLYYYVCELQQRGKLAGPEPLILDIARIPRATSCERTIERVRALAGRLAVDDVALEAAIGRTNSLRATVAAPVGERPRCLIAGTPAPDLRLHEAVSAAGFEPVGRTLVEEWMDLGAPVDEASGDPAAAIGRQLHARAGGPRSFADPAASLAAAIEGCGATAAVLWRIEEDEAQAWHLPAERRGLEEAGLPALVLSRRDWLARDGAIAEIREFLEGLAQ